MKAGKSLAFMVLIEATVRVIPPNCVHGSKMYIKNVKCMWVMKL